MLELAIILGVLASFVTMAWWLPRSWYRALLYTGGRPNAFTRRHNAAWAWVSSLGIAPSWMVSLETKGRRTGRTLRIPMVVAELGQERYLVSMLGESADWVRNLRASDGEAVLRHGIVERVILEEVATWERAPVLRAYLQRAPGARPHFDIGVHAPIEEFARVASRYPVFRILTQRFGKPM